MGYVACLMRSEDRKGEIVLSRRKVDLRLLLEQMQQERAVLESLDWLAAHLVLEESRQRVWEIRRELLALMLQDLELKEGVFER